MKIHEAAAQLDALFSIRQAEDFDNVGLLCGNPDVELTGFLVCHDALEAVVDEAVGKGLNMIVSFHPIIFSGLKSLTAKDYIQRAVMRAIENKIAIYAVHTALDNDYFGVNFKICEVLGLVNQKILMPKKNALNLLNIYVPEDYAEAVKDTMFASGAGNIGFYDECSFSVSGDGTFRPKEGSDPFSGQIGLRENAGEKMISVICEDFKVGNILAAARSAHPYEEVAFQVHALENENQYLGLGRYGDLPAPLPAAEFLKMIKEKFGLKVIRHSEILPNEVRRVGVLGGSGASGIKAAKASGCDAYLTGDLKYHDFFSAGEMLLCDIGHFESEQFVETQIFEKLSEKFPKFAVAKTAVNTNPVNYFL